MRATWTEDWPTVLWACTSTIGRWITVRAAGKQSAVRKILRQIDVEIVKSFDIAKGFAVLPKRWIVERTIAWLNRCRRLAKDWECLNRKALAFLRLASIRFMLRKLCQKTS